ncbi:hypothetical protein AAFF_G00268940 [Aldrovandia affinis]|uniref:Uncharacterized protein n=1 Tax=Aldrovandia affinis TaxID=143900 RepID=A0AAD7WSY4_9TELE|nr:hypothetical protein AAFF_G00268940 [Aldrovandia affinis]
MEGGGPWAEPLWARRCFVRHLDSLGDINHLLRGRVDLTPGCHSVQEMNDKSLGSAYRYSHPRLPCWPTRTPLAAQPEVSVDSLSQLEEDQW